MYTEHFGFNSLPFENVPDPKFFFNQGNHSRVHKQIAQSLTAGRGLMVVTGPMGSGKTTMSQMLIAEFSNDFKMIWVAMPPENSADLFLFLALELGLNPTSTERTFILREIREALVNNREEGIKCFVIIDESHLMSEDTINGLRLLNNLETGSIKLIQILLLGQEELLDLTNKPENEHFKQRIATLETLSSMNSKSINKYINHRLQIAGGDTTLFYETGLKSLILAFGAGSTPRTINSLCDKTFNICFQKGKKRIDIDDVYTAAEHMGLQKNVFLYKVELKQKQEKLEGKIDQEIDKDYQIQKASQNEPDPKSSKLPPELYNKRKTTKKRKRPTTRISPKASKKHSKIGDPKKHKASIIMLTTSIITFIVSIAFYIQKCQGPDLLTCLHLLFRI